MKGNEMIKSGAGLGADVTRTAGSDGLGGDGVSEEQFVDTCYDFLRYRYPSQETISVLINQAGKNNIKACYCLAADVFSEQLSIHDQQSVGRVILSAAKENDPFYAYIKGCYLVAQKKQQSVSRGIQYLHDSARNGAPEAYWRLAEYYAERDLAEAVIYARKAASAGWPAAVKGMRIAHITVTSAAKEVSERIDIILHNHQMERQSLNQQCDALSKELVEVREKCLSSDRVLEERCQKAESLLASWSAEALKDEHILKLQSSKKKAEEDWLEAKCAQEDADALRIKAERLADDFARRNKYLASILRKRGIPFNEYESSSSSEGGPQ